MSNEPDPILVSTTLADFVREVNGVYGLSWPVDVGTGVLGTIWGVDITVKQQDANEPNAVYLAEATFDFLPSPSLATIKLGVKTVDSGGGETP